MASHSTGGERLPAHFMVSGTEAVRREKWSALSPRLQQVWSMSPPPWAAKDTTNITSHGPGTRADTFCKLLGVLMGTTEFGRLQVGAGDQDLWRLACDIGNSRSDEMARCFLSWFGITESTARKGTCHVREPICARLCPISFL